jgi:hypothetical protein
LLGLKICRLLLALFSDLGLLFFGFGKLADQGMDRILDRQQGGVLRLLVGLGLAWAGAWIGALSLGYWVGRSELGWAPWSETARVWWASL